MAQGWHTGSRRLGVTLVSLLGSLISGELATGMLPIGNTAIAQIIPDQTLGTERSQVAPNSNIRGLPGVLIQGGAVRGRNLFQSFQEFNVGAGQRVYFANPTGIEAILSRVTGANPSRIFGLLGVDGAANLFLMNPNGIVFGANARLDIAGSFVATTSDRLTFENGATFSATNPEAPPLLTVTLRPHLPYGTNYQGTVNNAGNLAVGSGQTLSLQGKTVTHTGTLSTPGGTVQVLGDRVSLLNSAQIDVSAPNGGGTVLVGGDFQGQGVVPNAQQTEVDAGVTITADAQQTGNGGRVIVWADGTTRFAGTISAKGGQTAGDGGFVEVSGKQTLNYTGLVNTSATNGRIGTLLLDPFDFEINDSNVGSINQSPTTVILAADNNITFNAPVNITAFNAGLSADAGNNIFVNRDITTNGGDVVFTAGNGVFVNGVTINTNPFEDVPDSVSGAIVLSGGNQVSVSNSALLSRGNNGRDSFSAIGIVSPNGSVKVDRSFISTTNFGTGFAGDVVITARDQVAISNSEIFSQGNEGRIYLGETDYDGFDFSPKNVEISNSLLQTSNGASASASADAGNIIVQALESVSITANSMLRSRAESTKQGNAGGIGIGTGTLFIQDSVLDTSTFAQGSSAYNFSDFDSSPTGFGSNFAGAVLLLASGDITLDGSDIFNNLENGASGQAGVVYIEGRSLSLFNGSQIQTLVRGVSENGPAAEGQAGNILIAVDKTVKVVGRDNEGFPSAIFSTVGDDAVGIGGNVWIQARSLHVRDGARISVDNNGLGLAGEIRILALGVWLDNNATIRANTFLGFGGNVILNVPGAIILGRDSGIFASTRLSPEGQQGGGNITIGSGTLFPFSVLARGITFTGLEFDGSTLLVAGKTPRDNNILARGFEAAGGVIRINAFRLQDIDQRPNTSATNDISTASFFNVDGLTVVNALNIFPSFRVDPLPDRTEVPKIAQGCDPRIRQESSQFVISGRGGLPPNPADGLNQSTLVETRAAPTTVSQASSSSNPDRAIAPARGWIRNPDGTIRLVAEVTDPSAPIAPALLWSTPSCNAP